MSDNKRTQNTTKNDSNKNNEQNPLLSIKTAKPLTEKRFDFELQRKKEER